MNPSTLMLGPLIRYVDSTSASVWVETSGSARVTVSVAHDRSTSWDAVTFAVHGHHYALVEVTGLEPGSVTPYTVQIDGTTVWPPGPSVATDAADGKQETYPPSVISTLDPDRPLQMVFGSCRTTVAHDAHGNRTHGVDAMRAFALKLAGTVSAKPGADPEPDLGLEPGPEPGSPQGRPPDLMLFLGDQVYADETSPEMQEFIESRRDINEPPGKELRDYAEYAHLYRLAWSDPANRWLLSTVPSAMIFDDHDIRDDWNTSHAWKAEMRETSWWQQRIVSGLASYWVYQHLGNLSPAERREDRIWRLVAAHKASEELDLSDELDELAAQADADPETYRWSFAREFGDVRLVVVDTRAARVLREDERAMLDSVESAWLAKQMRGDCRHLLVGTSLPFLLSPGLHYLEAWDEALVERAWGKLAARFGEKVRQGADLEHWAAFQRGFQEMAGLALDVSTGKRGKAPSTVTFLSGDVHHSYVAEVVHSDADASRIIQAVCSPIRNPLPRVMRYATAVLSYGLATPLGSLASRSAKVAEPPFVWDTVEGPWFDNNLATLEDAGEGLRMRWESGVVENGDHAHPRLETVAAFTVGADRPRPTHRHKLPARLRERTRAWGLTRG